MTRVISPPPFPSSKGEVEQREIGRRLDVPERHGNIFSWKSGDGEESSTSTLVSEQADAYKLHPSCIRNASCEGYDSDLPRRVAPRLPMCSRSTYRFCQKCKLVRRPFPVLLASAGTAQYPVRPEDARGHLRWSNRDGPGRDRRGKDGHQ